MKLNGIFTAITTPFDADGAVAVDRLRENIARYNRLPLAGYRGRRLHGRVRAAHARGS